MRTRDEFSDAHMVEVLDGIFEAWRQHRSLSLGELLTEAMYDPKEGITCSLRRASDYELLSRLSEFEE